MRKINKKALWFLLIGGLSLIFINLIGYFTPDIVNHAVCRRDQELREVSLAGIIQSKFIDEKNHASEMLLLYTKEGVNWHIYLKGDSSSLFKRAVVGDSIFKAAGTMEVTLKKEQKTASFIVDYGCDH